MRTGIVYTETIVHSAPPRLAAEAPYQIAVVDFPGGERQMVRVKGERARIGDELREIEGDAGCFEVQQ